MSQKKSKVKHALSPIQKQAVAAEFAKLEQREEIILVFDQTFSAANAGSGATLVTVSAIPQGVAQGDRVGDQINFHDFTFNFQIVQINADLYSNFRIMFFQWKVNTGLQTPTLADILQNTSAIGLYSMTNWPLRDQFNILYDEIHGMSGSTTSLTSQSDNAWINLKLSRRPKRRVIFNAGATSGSNQIYLLVISDSAIAPFPQYNLATRYFYVNQL